MIIADCITFQQKNLFIKILYNQEAVLLWDFIEMEKVKKEVVLAQKIQIIEYKTWQVPSFQIPKTLFFTIIDMLQKRLKMGVIEPNYNPYQNLWYLVKKINTGK